jgi:hypothetical protein
LPGTFDNGRIASAVKAAGGIDAWHPDPWPDRGSDMDAPGVVRRGRRQRRGRQLNQSDGPRDVGSVADRLRSDQRRSPEFPVGASRSASPSAQAVARSSVSSGSAEWRTSSGIVWVMRATRAARRPARSTGYSGGTGRSATQAGTSGGVHPPAACVWSEPASGSRLSTQPYAGR